MKKRVALLCALTLALALCLPAAGLAQEAPKTPKYVFMFIGDGMGSPQITATQYFKGTLENPAATVPTPAELAFTQFPALGLTTTYDASSFCPDSASTATAMASGNKTLSGVINYNVDLSQSFKLITEYAKEAGKKVGVISSVSVDHATPAAFYAKVQSRKQHYDIAVQGLTGTTLDFLGGGGFLKPDGEDGTQKNVLDIAQENGWNYANTNDAIRALDAKSGRVLAVNPDLQDSMAMTYEIDRQRRVAAGEDILSLADFVSAGIRVLDNDNGFYLMCEGGKIDWSCHANDADTSIYETLAFSDAVQVAVDFAAAHPDDTLILVTADHETGGMTIGFAATAYATHFDYLQSQKTSFTDFDKEIATLRDSKATFETALAAIEQNYGLTTAADQPLTLTEAELQSLKAAYELSMLPADQRTLGDADALLYGGYEPLSMAVSHIINNKAGLGYTSYAHTGLQVPVYAMGVDAQAYQGLYDDTALFTKTLAALGVNP